MVKEHYQKNHNNNAKVENKSNELFRMVLPPPNVTGNLHIGHALTVTMEDSVCRYNKNLGKNVLIFLIF